MTLFETKKHQYNDDEVKSVIQKTIRRGDEEGSLFFALELAHESNPDFVLRISKAVDDMVLLYESNNEEWETSLAYVILLLCRSPKSRIANHFKVYVKSCWEDDTGRFNIDIPDYALDYHTTKGNKLGRIKHSRKGIDHFIKAGEKLINETIEIEDIYKKKAHRVWREKLPSEKEIINP
jgi:replication-associated recombination protein RarA